MTDGKAFDGSRSMHESIFIFGLKLFAILFLTDLAYSLIDVFLLDIDYREDLFHHLNVAMLIVHVIKSFVQIYLVFILVFRWLYHTYYIVSSDKKLFEQKGFIHTREKMFDLKNLRDIKIDQTVFGKIFGYGDIVINTSASGGYQETIVLKRIQNPQKNMEVFKSCV